MMRFTPRELAILERRIVQAEAKLDALNLQIRASKWAFSEASWSFANHAREHKYPSPPPPTVDPSVNGGGVPEVPGIYFVWSAQRIRYVGQSVKLNRRCQLSHDKICRSDRLSFLLMPVEILDYAESFYIGTLFPDRNFGGDARRVVAA